MNASSIPGGTMGNIGISQMHLSTNPNKESTMAPVSAIAPVDGVTGNIDHPGPGKVHIQSVYCIAFCATTLVNQKGSTGIEIDGTADQTTPVTHIHSAFEEE
jgi:hypothetical protein